MRPRFYKRGRIFHRRVHSSKLAFLRARSDQNGIFTDMFKIRTAVFSVVSAMKCGQCVRLTHFDMLAYECTVCAFAGIPKRKYFAV